MVLIQGYPSAVGQAFLPMQAGKVSNGYTHPIGSGTNKCNYFVADMWALGGGIGWDGKRGYPTNTNWLGRKYPPGANELASGAAVRNFNVVASPSIGDIVAFNAAPDSGHATLYLGGGLLIYAAKDSVKLETWGFVKWHEGLVPPVVRRYAW